MSRRYRRWVKDYQDQAWTLARYLLKDAQEAEDATQEAFVKLWRHRDNIDPNRIKPWLMKVTRNGCLDRLRRRRDIVELDEGHLDVEISGPMQSAAASELRDCLRGAIEGLKEPYRSLIVLRDVQQNSYQEMAGILELSLSQVKVYLHRARKELRDTTRRGKTMNDYDEKWEQQINALLDGELSEADADLLKAAATDDRNLSRAIVEAYRLQQTMEAIHVESAPASLRKKLRAIPRSNRPVLLQPRWVLALAAIPLALLVTSLMQPQRPTDSEIAQARRDLVQAFSYLDKAVDITGHEIETTVGRTMTDAIAGSTIRNIKSHNQSSKEKEA